MGVEEGGGVAVTPLSSLSLFSPVARWSGRSARVAASTSARKEGTATEARSCLMASCGEGGAHFF